MRISFVLALAFLPVAYSQQPVPKVGQQAPQQTPQQNQASDPKNLGILEGRVVNSKTGAPVRKASLTLRPMGGPGMAGGGTAMPAAYGRRTGNDGQIRIQGGESGRYWMSADKHGI